MFGKLTAWLIVLCISIAACSGNKDKVLENQNENIDSLFLDELHSRVLSQTSLSSATRLAKEEAEYAHSKNRYSDETRALLTLYDIYLSHGSNLEALKYVKEACDVADSVPDARVKAKCLHSLGIVCARLKNNTIASKNLAMSMHIYRALNDTINFVRVRRDFARVYTDCFMFDSTSMICNVNINIDKKISDIEGFACDYAMLGYNDISRYIKGLLFPDTLLLESAYNNFKTAMIYNSDAKSKYAADLITLGMTDVYYNMANIESNIERRRQLQDSCLYWVKHALKIAIGNEDNDRVVRYNIEKIQIYLERGETENVRRYVDSIVLVANNNPTNLLINKIAELSQAKLCWHIGKFKDAYTHQTTAEMYSDAMQNVSESYQQTLRIASGQHIEEQMKAQGRERELKAKARMRAIGMVVAVAVLALMSVIVILVLRSSRRTKKLNAMISTYNAEITDKNNKISMQNAAMTDSINYASIIQIAAMPSKEEMEDIFGDNLVWLKPKNVVSGDFFWTMDADRYKLLVVGDCTGHGVPGALLSMLGMSILDYMTRHFGAGDIKAAPLLDRMRRYFKRTLNQKSYRTDVAIDSIDLALLVIDTETGLLQYTAAFRPLLIFRNGMPIKMRADSMPIGVYPKEKEHFTNNEIQLCKGDILYLYSDGFTDQTGYESVLSPIARAYSSKRFISFLQKIHTLPFSLQYEKLMSEFEWWRSAKSPSQALCEQTDDNVVVGIAVDNFINNLPD